MRMTSHGQKSVRRVHWTYCSRVGGMIACVALLCAGMVTQAIGQPGPNTAHDRSITSISPPAEPVDSPKKPLAGAPSTKGGKTAVVRLPAWAGRYYPQDPGALLSAVRDRFEASDAPIFTSRVMACIVPPAAVGAGGSVTASALKSLRPGQYDRVIILCPSHYVAIDDCATPEADAFLTPLGPVTLDNDALGRLSISTLFVSRPPRPPRRPGPHDIEPGIEAVLPFLQERLVDFRLVPVLVGRLADGGGKFSPARAAAVARLIQPLVTDRTLVIAVSGFTHFGNDFSNRPFNSDIPEGIARLDRQAFDLVLAMDADGFDRYVEKTGNAIDGRAVISVLLRLLPSRVEPRLVDYLTTGELMNNWDRSISYAAFVFLDPSTPALPAHPDTVHPLPMKPVPNYPLPPDLPSYLPVPAASAPSQSQGSPPPLAPADPAQPRESASQ